MKICMISPSYPSTNCGIATYTGYLINELQHSANVKIVGADVMKSGKIYTQMFPKDIADAEIIHIQHAFDLFGYLGYKTPRLYSRIRKLGKPIITTIHELPNHQSPSLKERLVAPYFKWLIRVIMKNSDAIIVHSETSCKQLSYSPFGDRLRVIPHGTLTAHHLPIHRSDSRRAKTIGFFGFIKPHKGIHLIIQALRKLEGVKFLIAGSPKSPDDHRYLDYLKELIQQFGLQRRVEFVGFILDEQMADFFTSVDIAAFPYSRCTATGALHLAAAHESVILASDIEIFRELKRDYNCLEIFDLSDLDDLVTKIEDLLHNDHKREELVSGCRKLVTETSWSAVALKTYAIYQQLITHSI